VDPVRVLSRRLRGRFGIALVPVLLLLAASCSNQLPTKPLATVHVEGSIRDRDGAGLSGVQVHIFGSGFGTTNAYAMTDSTGAFELDLLEGKYVIYLWAPEGLGLSDLRLDNVSVTPDSRRIDYRYTGILIRGTVLAPTGASLDSGHVQIYSEGEGNYYAVQQFHSGSFSFLVPGPGMYRVSVHPLKDSFPRLDNQALAVTGDTTLVIQIHGVPVAGRVLGPDGAGLEGATIDAERYGLRSYGKSGPGGTYEFWVPEGGYRFLISPPYDMTFILARISSFVTISGPTTLDVSLAGTRWSGLVRSLADSSVVSDAGISAAVVADSYNRRAIDRTGADGAFELVLEPGKEYDLSIINSPGLQPLVIRGLVAGADSTFDVYVDNAIP